MDTYYYESEKGIVFTDKGIKEIIRLIKLSKTLSKDSGVFTSGALIRNSVFYNSYNMMACVDYLIEEGTLKVVCDNGAWQNKVLSL